MTDPETKLTVTVGELAAWGIGALVNIVEFTPEGIEREMVKARAYDVQTKMLEGLGLALGDVDFNGMAEELARVGITLPRTTIAA